MKNLVKFKSDIIDLLIEKYHAQYILDIKDIVKNLKSFPLERFYDYYIFSIKYMKYIIGFDISYNMIIFYSDGVCSEGFYQYSPIEMEFILIEQIDLLQKRKEELNKFIEWFKEKYNNLNNGS